MTQALTPMCPTHPDQPLRLVAYRKTKEEDPNENFKRFPNIRYCKVCNVMYEVDLTIKPLRIVKMISR